MGRISLSNTALSIITPVLNCERFIGACINNVIEQNCEDAEHLIMDGGSTDGTVEIIKRYAGKHSHIKWVSKEDEGQSDAMNKGIAMSRGRIISFLNADDYYNPGVFSAVLQIMQGLKEPAFVAGNCKRIDENGNVEWNIPRLDIRDVLFGLYFSDSNSWFPINSSSYFYHKSLHDKVGMYEVDNHNYMDVDFILRAFQVANLKYVNKHYGNMRYLPGTKTFENFEYGKDVDWSERYFEKYIKLVKPSIRRSVEFRIFRKKIYLKLQNKLGTMIGAAKDF